MYKARKPRLVDKGYVKDYHTDTYDLTTAL